MIRSRPSDNVAGVRQAVSAVGWGPGPLGQSPPGSCAVRCKGAARSSAHRYPEASTCGPSRAGPCATVPHLLPAGVQGVVTGNDLRQPLPIMPRMSAAPDRFRCSTLPSELTGAAGWDGRSPAQPCGRPPVGQAVPDRINVRKKRFETSDQDTDPAVQGSEIPDGCRSTVLQCGRRAKSEYRRGPTMGISPPGPVPGASERPERKLPTVPGYWEVPTLERSGEKLRDTRTSGWIWRGSPKPFPDAGGADVPTGPRNGIRGSGR